MLPHSHFIISGLAAVPIAAVLSPEKPIIEWALISGLLSSAIDLDVYTLVLLKSRKEDILKPFRNPLKILKEYKNFMQTITETGVLRIGLKTHFVLPAFIALLIYFLFPAYFIPAAVGIVTHIISDIPNLRRLVKK
ncbi:MAG: hypothetical protein WA240_06920 [Nitrospirota bacterium]